MYLSDFNIQIPPYTYKQQDSFDVLLHLHMQAEQGEAEFQKKIKERITKVCCGSDKISMRKSVVTHDWVKEKRGLGERTRFYQAFVEEVFSQFYPLDAQAPEDLIHVTCTGYCSPSAAQKIVLKRGWGKRTTVTHAYHMGCMAALPALRMALGFASCGKKRVDIVHTELCSIHFNPALHADDQLVAQSLFADGLIKYSLYPSLPMQPSLRVHIIEEELIPNTEEMLKWECEDWGLKMTLSKEIPILIGRSIHSFMEKLEKASGVNLNDAIYAIHPGGPKIIEMIGKKLQLRDEQLKESIKILYKYGNMSSATLPHIWEDIVKNQEIASGSYIVGLAFGPGLCMCGALLQKV